MVMSGKESLRIEFTLPRTSSASVGSSGLTTPSVPLGMQTRRSVMASKETKKRGATGVGEETGTKKKPRTKADEQAAFAEEFEEDFEAMPVEPKKTKAKGTKEGGKGTKRKAGETEVSALDESLGIFPAFQKSLLTDPPRRPRFTPGSRLRESCTRWHIISGVLHSRTPSTHLVPSLLKQDLGVTIHDYKLLELSMCQ
jgi:hypothetical protein